MALETQFVSKLLHGEKPAVLIGMHKRVLLIADGEVRKEVRLHPEFRERLVYRGCNIVLTNSLNPPESSGSLVITFDGDGVPSGQTALVTRSVGGYGDTVLKGGSFYQEKGRKFCLPFWQESTRFWIESLTASMRTQSPTVMLTPL